MRVSLICALGSNRAIGRQGDLPWHISEDLKRFKRVTMGHPIIMGRKTYESIGRALPGRTNIIVTRNDTYQAKGCELVHGLDDALARARELEPGADGEEREPDEALREAQALAHVDGTIECEFGAEPKAHKAEKKEEEFQGHERG